MPFLMLRFMSGTHLVELNLICPIVALVQWQNQFRGIVWKISRLISKISSTKKLEFINVSVA